MSKDVRYNLRLSQEIYDRVGDVALQQETSRLAIMRQCMRIGLVIFEETEYRLYVEKEDGTLERVVLI